VLDGLWGQGPAVDPPSLQGLSVVGFDVLWLELLQWDVAQVLD